MTHLIHKSQIGRLQSWKLFRRWWSWKQNLQKDNQTSLIQLVDTAFSKGVISKNTHDYLIVQNPRTPCLYLLPKVHKNAKNPPGRPIVSGNGGLCEPLCRDEHGELQTDLFRKETSVNSLLHATS